MAFGLLMSGQRRSRGRYGWYVFTSASEQRVAQAVGELGQAAAPVRRRRRTRFSRAAEATPDEPVAHAEAVVGHPGDGRSRTPGLGALDLARAEEDRDAQARVTVVFSGCSYLKTSKLIALKTAPLLEVGQDPALDTPAARLCHVVARALSTIAGGQAPAADS